MSGSRSDPPTVPGALVSAAPLGHRDGYQSRSTVRVTTLYATGWRAGNHITTAPLADMLRFGRLDRFYRQAGDQLPTVISSQPLDPTAVTCRRWRPEPPRAAYAGSEQPGSTPPSGEQPDAELPGTEAPGTAPGDADAADQVATGAADADPTPADPVDAGPMDAGTPP